MYVEDEGSPIAISFLATFNGYPIYIQDWWEEQFAAEGNVSVKFSIQCLHRAAPHNTKQFQQWNLLLVAHLDIEMGSWNPLLPFWASIEALPVFSHFWLNLN